MGIALKKDILYNRIKDDILSGKLKPGQKLPQGLVLAKELGVSYITLRRTFTETCARRLHRAGAWKRHFYLRK